LTPTGHNMYKTVGRNLGDSLSLVFHRSCCSRLHCSWRQTSICSTMVTRWRYQLKREMNRHKCPLQVC